MTTRAIKLSCLLLVASIAIAHAKEPKRRSTAVHDGLTIDTPIVIKAPLKKYVDVEWAYIKKRYPDAQEFPGEQAMLIHGDGYVDAMTFTTSHGKKTMYFDISGVK